MRDLRRLKLAIACLIFIFLFVGCDIKRATDNQYIPVRDSRDSPPVITNPNQLVRRVAEGDPPRTPGSLKELVISLLEVTPAANLTDSDADSLPDLVEAVIGTNPQSNDTDVDLLTDDFEVYNDLDPRNPDSNDDGLCDSFEVDTDCDGVPDGVHVDSDNDGIKNGWDFDNDGDGVNDAFDVSPFAYSEVNDKFSIVVNTNSMPLYAEFQIVPEDPLHLRLLYQTWDWPDWDNESTMTDLDNSKDDIILIPYLEIITDTIPSEDALQEQGIVPTSSGMRLRLSPVIDNGEVVAFSGIVYYPGLASTSVTFQTELVWSVHGYTDFIPNALLFRQNWKYLSVGNEGVASVTASEGIQGALQLCYLSESEVALKLINGNYLSVSDNGTLFFNSSTIGERETFNQRIAWWPACYLTDYLGNYVAMDGRGNLVSTPDIALLSIFEIESLEPIPNLIELVTYTEPFKFTGLKLEESTSSEIGIFYNSTNTDMTIGASLLFDYYYMKNSSNTVSDLQPLLMDNNITVESDVRTFQSQFDALSSLGSDMLPSALSSISQDMILPITVIIEDHSRVVDMSGVSFGTDGHSSIDLTSLAPSVMKTLKMNYYNTTSYEALSITEIVDHIVSWGLDDEVTYWIVTMTLMWFSTERSATVVDGTPRGFPIDRISDMEFVSQNVGQWVDLGIESFLLLPDVPSYFRGLQRIFDSFTEAGRKFHRVRTLHQMAKVAKGASKASGWVSKIGKFDVIIEIVVAAIALGLTIWAAWEIADAIGGAGGQEYGAIWGIVTFLWDVIIAPLLTTWATFFTFGLAGIFMLIDEILGWCGKDNIGVSDAIKEFFINAIYGRPHQIVAMWPSSRILDIDPTFMDFENNGLTAGDGILLTCRLLGRISAYGTYLNTYFLDSWCMPHFWIATSDLNHFYWQAFNFAHNTTNIQTYMPTWPDLDPIWTYLGTATQSNPAWIQQEWSQTQSIGAPIAMANYPVTIGLYSFYKTWSVWYHEWLDTWDCWHYDPTISVLPSYSSAYSPFLTQIYFDVFPASFDEFLKWGLIANDFDVDGLNNTREASMGVSNIWRYDTDSDGLNDKYEIEIGTDPASIDTDNDKLNDKFELVCGTDPNNIDTDQDGLSDYLEITGWIISFDYMGNTSLPFSTHVTSNPLLNETDGDGLDDFTEYESNTNPRSNDTNGDGILDSAYVWYGSGVYYEGKFVDWTMDGTNNKISDICVDEYGYVYANGILDSVSGNNTIRKYDSNLTRVTLPQESVFNNMTFLPSGARLVAMAVDDSNDWLYTQVSPLFSSPIFRFNLNGTITNPGSWSPILNKNITDLDFGDDGVIYAAVRDTGDDQIGGFRKYGSDGSVLATYGNRGPADDETDWITSMAVDEKYGIVYLCDRHFSYSKPDRVIKMRLSDGAFLGTLSENYVSILDVDVDSDGYVYVLGELSDGMCVQKFYPNGVEDTAFRFYGNGITNFTTGTYVLGSETHQLAVAPDKSIYVLDWIDLGTPSTSRIWKFSQNVTLSSELLLDTNPDWDNDGLTNIQEIDGWVISVNFTHGQETFRVHSNHLMNDSDLDGLDDFLEFSLGSNPSTSDTDLDGVSDHQEWWKANNPGETYIPPTFSPHLAPSTLSASYMQSSSGSSLTLWDSDGDSLGDGLEMTFGSNPAMADSDFDTLSDLEEFLLNSNPLSADSDYDGASDALEYQYNTSLLHADSDGDLSLDGDEYSRSTNPLGGDSDSDGLSDSYEWFIGTNPLNSDSDSDGVSDSLEVAYWLDALNNDTDGDGILDGVELEWGSNPWNVDSDFDGVPDNEDPDTFSPWRGPIILAHDPEDYNDTILFAEKLRDYADVTIVSIGDLTSLYSDSQYIVLIGRPESESSTVGGLVYDLLGDTGSVLTDMMEPDSHEIATRYGVWSNPQTVVMLSQAFPEDVYSVLQILRGRNFTILPNMIALDYQKSVITDNETYHYSFLINEIDTLKTLDATLLVQLSGLARPSVQIVKYDASTTPHELVYSTGLVEGEVSLHKYLDVTITLYDTAQDVFESALIQIYYRVSDLDLTNDGQLGDLGDINETSLSIYYYDTEDEQWIKLSEDLDWVISLGQNTTNVEIYGESYAGCIWAQVTHLSLFGVSGQLIAIDVAPPDYFMLALLLGGIGFVAVIVVVGRKKRKPGYKMRMDIVDQLLDSS
ncbi:MAG: hypothetical protein JSW61_08030 [Candidatus Thorarchaeota archaeon]|nr:MAG: hypothetical protein JSW61_08030 [Candidatus Thorarchaeota archaeon]